MQTVSSYGPLTPEKTGAMYPTALNATDTRACPGLCDRSKTEKERKNWQHCRLQFPMKWPRVIKAFLPQVQHSSDNVLLIRQYFFTPWQCVITTLQWSDVYFKLKKRKELKECGKQYVKLFKTMEAQQQGRLTCQAAISWPMLLTQYSVISFSRYPKPMNHVGPEKVWLVVVSLN